MRVLIAPDCFGGTLSAPEAAAAIAAGWAGAAANDVLVQHPLADGGPGFLDVLATALPGRSVGVEVTDPWGSAVTAQLLVVGATVYIESAQAVGTQLAAGRPLDPAAATSRGLGQLLAAALALEPQPSQVWVGLGGTAVMDGGAGAAEVLDAWSDGVGLRICTDVLVPLLGPTGAVHGFGEQKGAAREELAAFEKAMAARADALEASTGRSVRDVPGAGAAGGLGAWLISFGADVVSGAELVAVVTGLGEQVAQADLVVTGEGRTDAGSLRGKVVGGVAALAAAAGKPCVVISGQVEIGRREGAAHGIDETFSCAELAGTPQAAMVEPRRWLEAAAAQAARSWSASRA